MNAIINQLVVITLFGYFMKYHFYHCNIQPQELIQTIKMSYFFFFM